jgi:hypothetical protein
MNQFRIFHQNKSHVLDRNHSVNIRRRWSAKLMDSTLTITDETIRKQRSLVKLQINTDQNDFIHHFADGSSARFVSLVRAPAPDIQIASRITVVKPGPEIISKEEKIIQKNMKRISIVGSIACFLFMLVDLVQSPSTPNEELIPKKFAKLILTKPKEDSVKSATGSSSMSRAFRSKSVQRNLKTILQGGLGRYSIMASGKSIQNLQLKMNQQEKGNLALISGLSNRAIGSLSSGSTGQGIGASIQGQGSGQLEIGIHYQDASVDEGLTKEEVAKVIHGHLNEIRYCYETAINQDPSLAGKVMVDFRIGSKGLVSTAQTAENTMNDRQVAQCLIGKLKSWKFPEPRGGVQVAVSYPFLFRSVNR